MPRRNRLLATITASLLLVAGATGIVMASSGSEDEGTRAQASGGGFTPGKIKGKWTGQWRNTTFGSNGSIRANVQVRRGNRLVPLVDFGGFVFGCPNPPAATVTLRQGSGQNRWNNSGFKISTTTQAFGRLNINFNWANKTFKGNGSRPPCNRNITYTIDGRLTGSRFTATVKIDLGAQTATSRLSANKQ
jgi:hypothetical protein